jgi:DNA-binding NarL/FixJ family response regulator
VLFRSEETGVKGLVTPLTTREQEVLEVLVQGYKNKNIAITLNIKEKTVKTHVSNILRKLQQTDRTQAALFAIKMGLAEIKTIEQAEPY